MFYLFLAILCSASVALILKYSENTNANRYVITSANYFIAFAICLFMIFYKGLLNGLSKEISFLNDFKILLANDLHILSPYSSIIWAIIVGSLFGSFFFLSLIYLQRSIKANGVGLSGTISKLGILIPMIFSIIIWKEFPSVIQWIGITLSLLSILIVNLSPDSLRKLDINPTLILLFISAGMAGFSNKIFQKYALSEYKDVFLFATFFVAFLVSIFYTIKEKSEMKKRDILTGFAVGIPNLFSQYFLVLALETLKTSVAFPLNSAGSIVLMNLGGFLIYRESISRKNKIAILLTIISMVLINI